MTLVIQLAYPGGVVQASDFRLTALGSGEVLDDAAPKSLVARCPDGWLLIAFTGLARIPNSPSTGTMDWLRGELSGTLRTAGETLSFITETASATLGGFCAGRSVTHAFLFGGVVDGAGIIGAIHNQAAPGDPRVGSTFSLWTEAHDADAAPVVLCTGTASAVNRADIERIEDVANRGPSLRNARSLLAHTVMRTARSGRPGSSLISPHCAADSAPWDGSMIEGTVFKWGQAIPGNLHGPTIINGVDTGSPDAALRSMFHAQFRHADGRPFTPAEIDDIAQTADAPTVWPPPHGAD